MLFSIFSINTWKSGGEYDKRLPLLASTIDSFKPDIVLCQEVFHTVNERISTRDYLEDALGMKSYFYASRRKLRGGVDSFSGLCIFTNFDIIEYEELPLQSHSDDGERTAQYIHIDANNQHIGIINTHLTHLKNQEGLRASQMRQLLEFVQIKDVDVRLVCGDMNAEPDTDSVRILTQSALGFEDVFHTNEATHVGGRKIDYIFVDRNNVSEVVSHEIVSHSPEDAIVPSDHFGLFVTFNIDDKS